MEAFIHAACKTRWHGKLTLPDMSIVCVALLFNTLNPVSMQCVSRCLTFVFVCVLQFNFVGRILGPRGLTAKQLEAETGCKIMVRGKGSMRDKKKVSTCTYTCVVHSGGGSTHHMARSIL